MIDVKTGIAGLNFCRGRPVLSDLCGNGNSHFGPASTPSTGRKTLPDLTTSATAGGPGKTNAALRRRLSFQAGA